MPQNLSKILSRRGLFFSEKSVEKTIALFNPSQNLARQRHIRITVVAQYRTLKEDFLEQAFERLFGLFVPALETQTLKALAGQDDLFALARWAGNLVRRKGAGALRIVKITFFEEATAIEAIFDPALNNRKPKAENTSLRDGTAGFMHNLNLSEMVGRFYPDERFTTRNDRKNFLSLLEKKQEIPLVTIVCPPYRSIYENNVLSYDGIHDNFDDEPESYGFGYDYRKYINSVSRLARMGQQAGINLRPIVVLGDWALINIAAIRNTMGGEASIKTNLEKFRLGMTVYSQSLDQSVTVTSFQEIGVDRYLPLGFTTAPKEQHDWLLELNQETESWAGVELWRPLLERANNDQVLINMLDWRNFPNFPELIDNPSAIDILKVYRNICLIKWERQGNENKPDLFAEQLAHLRYSALVDAVLRFVQYRLYAHLVRQSFGSCVFCYQDDGLTACGNFFRHAESPVLFLDPDKILLLSETALV